MNKHPVQKAPGTSAMLLVDANSSRGGIMIQNAGTVRVHLGNDSTVSAASSVYLDPNDVLVEEAPAVSLDDWWGVAVSGTGDLRIVEVF